MTIRSDGLYGEIFHRGRRIGSTRDLQPISLPVGSYELEVSSEFVKPTLIKVFVSAGEHARLNLSLEGRPARVIIPAAWPGDCLVQVDDRTLGTLATIGRTIEVERPERPGHQLHLICGETVHPYKWPGPMLPESVFPLQRPTQ